MIQRRGDVIIKPIIKSAGPSDEASIVDVLVRAFSADPAARWGWPNLEQYLKHFPTSVRAFGGKAFTHGSAYYVDGYAAERCGFHQKYTLKKTN